VGIVVETVKVPAIVVAEPAELVNTARYLVPFADDVAVKEYVVEVAAAMAVQVLPALIEFHHWADGTGEPDAAALKETVEPGVTVVLAGCVVIVGTVVTVRVAAADVADPAELVNTARY
jgi:hypothetical protein